MNRKILLVVCVLLSAAANCQKDAYKKDILNACRSLLSAQSYSMELHYKLYVDNNTSSPYQERRVKMLRKGRNFYAKQNSQVEVVETGDYQVYIDHKGKTITSLERPGSTEESESRTEALQELGGDLDSIVKHSQKIRIVSEDDKTVKYECLLKPNKIIAGIWIEIDKKLGFYRSITTKYVQKQRIRELDGEEHFIMVTIEYQGFNQKPNVPSQLFDVKNYLIINNGKVFGPARKFDTYRYLNNS